MTANQQNPNAEQVPERSGTSTQHTANAPADRESVKAQEPPAPARGPSSAVERINQAREALLSYSQADADGVMVTTSRQAIHEVVEELDRLRAENEWFAARAADRVKEINYLCQERDRLRGEVERLQSSLDRISGMKFSDRMHAALVSRAERAEAALRGGVVVPEETLEHWLEYWNGAYNEAAMADALEFLLEEFRKLLAAAKEGKS